MRLSKTGLRVGQVFALDHDSLLDRIGADDAVAVLRILLVFVEHVDVGRVVAGVGDETEFQLRGRAQQILEALRILQARHLHQHAVGALALDVRLGRAERVDAPAQHFDRLIDGAAHPFENARIAQGEHDLAVAVLADVERRRAGDAKRRNAGRCRLLADFDQHGGAFGRIAETELNRTSGRADAADEAAGARLAQNAAHVVAQVFKLGAGDVG